MFPKIYLENDDCLEGWIRHEKWAPIVGPLLLEWKADGGNPKYTLRHGLRWDFIWVLPQGHVKVISRSNQPKRVRIFSFCCFCCNCINLGCL